MDWKIEKAEKGLQGTIKAPPDKSVSHRAVMFGAIANGKCRVNDFLFSDDCIRTLEAFRSMGIEINREDNDLIIYGKGLKGLSTPEGKLYMGNSGTSMRIISGIIAGQDFSTVITGDSSLSKRPMGRVIEPLSLMGADIRSLEGGDHAPFEVKRRGDTLRGVDYTLPMASAQVKSCVLAAGLYADGKTSVTEPFQSRDHTERMLEFLSADISRQGLTTKVSGMKELVPKDIDVPGDISSAAFFIVGALIVKESKIIIRGVGLNPTRTGLIDVLKRMGGEINILDKKDGVEPSGDLEISYSSLRGTTVDENEIPLLIDEIPVLSIAAAAAEGKTVFKGISELRVKETDRVKAIIDNLSAMGIKIEDKGNELIVHGGTESLASSELQSSGDHRMAMSFAIAALITDEGCQIKDTACVDTSYPTFLKDLDTLR